MESTTTHQLIAEVRADVRYLQADVIEIKSALRALDLRIDERVDKVSRSLDAKLERLSKG
jgi:hypothetical protein